MKSVQQLGTESQKIPAWRKVCYGCGAGGGNVMSTLLATFLLGYYTDTAGIAAAAIGTMFVICRLLDGVTDLLMGGIIDRTNTRLGKARPWLLLSAPLMAIGIILILAVPQGWDHAAKLVYAYVTYIFLNCIVFTIFGISHAALLARMTRNFKDRNTTATVSSILNNVVGLAVGTMITGLQQNFGWFVTGIILGAISGILILVTALTCPEVIGMNAENHKPVDAVPLKQQLPAVLKNRYFWLALVLGALTLLVNANAIGAQIFYCNVVLHDPMYMSALMTFGMLPGILVLFVMPYFANRFSKRAFMAGGAILMILGFSITGLADTNRTILAVGTVIRAIGIGPMFAGLYAFCADAADYGEWKYGVRSEGLMASSQSIGSKIGIGFGSACTAWILAAAGYVQPAMDALPPLDGPVGALPPMIEQPQSVINAIRFDYGWLGAIISVVLLVGVLFMDVEKYMPQIREALGEKKPPMM